MDQSMALDTYNRARRDSFGFRRMVRFSLGNIFSYCPGPSLDLACKFRDSYLGLATVFYRGHFPK
jgi:hypothetical protein